MKKNCKGIITVYLALSLFIVLSLITTVIASARDRAMRQRVEMSMDMGMQSIFAEYNRQLLKEFDLYFIDTSYGSDKGGIYNTKEHLEEYLQYNINPSYKQVGFGYRDLYGLSLSDVDISIYSLATDANARVYKRQAIHAMKDVSGISIVEKLTNVKKQYEANGIGSYDAAGKRAANAQLLKKADSARDKKGNKIHYEDPTKPIESQRGGILSFLLSGMEISDKKCDLNELASYREHDKGVGIIEDSGKLDSSTNNLLFEAYLLDKFSTYTENKGREGFSYELEYILKGKSSDKENLKQIINQLLMVREAANCISIFRDSNKKAQAKLVAIAIAIILEMPDIEKPLTNAILFAWAFAEACVDVVTLLDKGKVPLIKEPNDWILKNLTQALSFKAYLHAGKGINKGLNYNNYLGLFLLFEDEQKKLYRSMDMIENDMRQYIGNRHFKMDQCIEYIEAEADIKSIFGNSYNIKRYFGYEAMPKMSY